MRFVLFDLLSFCDTPYRLYDSSKRHAVCGRDHERRLGNVILRGEDCPEGEVHLCVPAREILRNYGNRNDNRVLVRVDFRGMCKVYVTSSYSFSRRLCLKGFETAVFF